ncbi:hypothetical protein GQX74_010111 [Glossina fuscipes]|nr:hypothetical protein GQX74_010111 [Glossina fuscipes]
MLLKIPEYLFWMFFWNTFTDAAKYPVVLWHGMGAYVKIFLKVQTIFKSHVGDTCCFPFSVGSITNLLKTKLNNTYVKSLEIGGNIVTDYESGFFIHPNKQVEYVCQELAKDKKLTGGYNAIGFSQGGQFLRAVAQRCPKPAMKVLISLGGQHQGVFGLPKCPSLKLHTCEYIRRLLNYAAYEEWTQQFSVQATYWHDPFQEDKYEAHSTFLADINNEVFSNGLYADNLKKLDKFVMLGLVGMEKQNKLVFIETEGDHLQFRKEWFLKHIIPFLSEEAD